jgi:hypothetical protein
MRVDLRIVAGGVAALMALVLATAGPASAQGSGYNLSYSAAANPSIVSSVDLVGATTSNSGGPNLTANLTVAGSPSANGTGYQYVWLFSGAGTNNSTAWVFVANGVGLLHSKDLRTAEEVNYTTVGSTLSVTVPTFLVGPSLNFTFNGQASEGNASNSSTSSSLGTNYNGGGGCSGSSCGASGGSHSSSWPTTTLLEGLVGVIVVVVIIASAVSLSRRRKKTNPLVSETGPPPR